MTFSHMLGLILEAIGAGFLLMIAVGAILRPSSRDVDALLRFEDERREAQE
jgi:hypothetical protein